jgi:benzoyl-CoA reductase/2-hydroxyglutaryl-CoA dehydratase subunit BcrC/BadD/HgdB
MEQAHEPETRSLFCQAHRGDWSICDLLVIASTADGYRFLFQYLTEMRRSGRGQHIPPLLLYDFLFGESPAVTHYNRQVVAGLQKRLAALRGFAASSGALAVAIQRTNSLRQCYERLQQARCAARITGVQALRWIAHCVESEAEAAIAAAEPLLAKTNPARTGPRLLLGSGVPFYHSRLHDTLESAGGVVTLEDDEWGARRYGPEIAVNGDPVDALLKHYHAHTPSPRQPTSRRQAWLRQRLRERNVAALILYAPPSDQFYGWECPGLIACARQQDTPALLLRHEATDPAQTAALAEQVASFLRNLPTALRS